MTPEAILDADLPIIDPHHHLWERIMAEPPPRDEHPFLAVVRTRQRYLMHELAADLNSGHNVRATVHLQCTSMYRADGAEAMRPIGETEFVRGIAAMSASGLYGPARACKGIVGWADLKLGAAVDAVIEAHLDAGADLFKGIRYSASWSADPNVLGPLNRVTEGLYRDAVFREGFARIGRYGLSFDAWCLEPQMGDVADLADTFPDTPIVLDHLGTPIGRGSYEGRLAERFPVWKDAITDLSKRPNVHMKLGGLAMAFCNFPSFRVGQGVSSQALAADWAPYIETAIEAFGAQRCMFESNFPVDSGPCDYATLWNAFKRIAAGCSTSEKADLFFGAANRFYRLGL